ncbi:mitochondrial carrier [Coccomyxa subellipsoidea C-169]|uniref:Mitochondrial carrier n=1 Tax=Coccomyxa subellipsoidea (strain C-169) TaxID=574566 RepID=I0Z0T8_COCSC|nr:mitochondrial carrier [Coccomyxa subellipsoidea C-169]EIE24257.1 mitochondrial carrier [Coccomyxa subellipsoidea C-169]|eukprot:XP_005648801.1 mitochondrial carrier [Coccomyxa subellipsoidea C-169]
MGWPADVRRFLAGAFAGAISKTATAPIESVRMQIMTGTKGSVWEIVGRTYERGGLLAFFSGNEADVLRTMPSKAIELASFDLYKKAFANFRPKGADGKQHPSGLGVTVAGALAGVTSTLAMFPLETVRTRLAVDHKTYRNVFTAFRIIFGQEGVPAFYRGLGASVLGVIPYSAIRLGSYDGLKWAYKRTTQQENVPAHVTMMFGAFAAIASSSASFPLEIVRRRAMMGTLPTTGTLAALMAIARTEGVGALYAGVWLTWVKQAPQYAVTFLCYDLAKAWLAAENGEAREKRAAELRASAAGSGGGAELPGSTRRGLPVPQG